MEAGSKLELTSSSPSLPTPIFFLGFLSKLLDGGKDGGLVVEFEAVGRVDVDFDSDEYALEGILRSGVHNLRTDRGGVGGPRNENNLKGGGLSGTTRGRSGLQPFSALPSPHLGGWASVVGLELEVDEYVPAVILGEGLAEVIVGLVEGPRLVNIDELVVICDLVREEADLVGLVLQLEIFERLDDVVGYRDSRGLRGLEGRTGHKGERLEGGD